MENKMTQEEKAHEVMGKLSREIYRRWENPMRTSAESCYADAEKQYDQGNYARAEQRAHRGLGYILPFYSGGK
jgi:hypothetical protein|tara:strand:+ start:309 stop:527 length:219 start_codon:yes stop_codon:yes gene_type:complete